jgi:serine/threonine-protein kinase
MDEEDLYGDVLGPGALIGDYLVERRCSSGGFSVVYRTQHLPSKQPAAVKVLRSHLLASSRVLRRFREEATLLQKLRHPQIVEIREYGELRDGRPFIAMEWLEGRTLQGELAVNGPFSTREALTTLIEIGEALEATHALGLVHRDLKAQNVMAVPSGTHFTAKLIDFGVAKRLAAPEPGRPALSSQGVTLGTPIAMAPEQILSGPVDGRTDLYACGVLLYQLLTGVTPFLGQSAIELEEQHLTRQPMPPSSLAPVTPGLERVVLRCLQKRPEDRFPDARSFLLALKELLNEPAPDAPAFGIYLAAHFEPAIEVAPSEAQLDARDDLLERARTLAANEHLSTVLHTDDALLLAGPLNTAHHSEAERRTEWLRLGLRLTELEMATSEGRIRLGASIHVAPARFPVEGSPSGELLRLGDWATRTEPGVVLASSSAVEGLEAHFQLEPSGRLRPK